MTKKTPTHKTTVTDADEEEEEDEDYCSTPPRNPNHVLEGPDNDENDVIIRKTGHTHKRATVVDVSDEEDDEGHCSTPPHNPNHVLEGPDDDENQAVDIADDGDDSVPENPAESAEAELSKSNEDIIFVRGLTLLLEWLSQKWTSPIYVFFWPTPRIEYINSHRVHVFQCAAKHCKGRNGRGVRQFLDKGDTKLTSGLHRHVKTCWRAETVDAALNTKDLDGARAVLGKTELKDGSITAAFEHIGKGKVTYSHRQYTYAETRYEGAYFVCPINLFPLYRAEIIRWVAESKRLFSIVKDRGFKSLMKTGCPEYRLSSPQTVSQDVKHIFVKVRQWIAKLLKVKPPDHVPRS